VRLPSPPSRRRELTSPVRSRVHRPALGSIVVVLTRLQTLPQVRLFETTPSPSSLTSFLPQEATAFFLSPALHPYLLLNLYLAFSRSSISFPFLSLPSFPTFSLHTLSFVPSFSHRFRAATRSDVSLYPVRLRSSKSTSQFGRETWSALVSLSPLLLSRNEPLTGLYSELDKTGLETTLLFHATKLSTLPSLFIHQVKVSIELDSLALSPRQLRTLERNVTWWKKEKEAGEREGMERRCVRCVLPFYAYRD
jgi:hypothetical protein